MTTRRPELVSARVSRATKHLVTIERRYSDGTTEAQQATWFELRSAAKQRNQAISSFYKSILADAEALLALREEEK